MSIRTCMRGNRRAQWSDFTANQGGHWGPSRGRTRQTSSIHITTSVALCKAEVNTEGTGSEITLGTGIRGTDKGKRNPAVRKGGAKLDHGRTSLGQQRGGGMKGLVPCRQASGQ